MGLDAWASLAKELEARDVAEVIAMSQPISVAIPEPYRSGHETDQCADATWGFDHIDSVDLPFTNEYEWETAFEDDGAGTNVYVFDTGINVNNGDFGGRAINRYSCVSRRCYSLCAAVIGRTDNDENGRGTHVEGTVISSVEEKVADRGRLARTSGTSCVIVGHSDDGRKTHVRLPSGSWKTLMSTCRAMVGIVAGGGRMDKPVPKGGANFHKYKVKRNCWPKVRGCVMNPVEHPHGGGNHQRVWPCGAPWQHQGDMAESV